MPLTGEVEKTNAIAKAVAAAKPPSYPRVANRPPLEDKMWAARAVRSEMYAPLAL